MEGGEERGWGRGCEGVEEEEGLVLAGEDGLWGVSGTRRVKCRQTWSRRRERRFVKRSEVVLGVECCRTARCQWPALADCALTLSSDEARQVRGVGLVRAPDVAVGWSIVGGIGRRCAPGQDVGCVGGELVSDAPVVACAGDDGGDETVERRHGQG